MSWSFAQRQNYVFYPYNSVDINKVAKLNVEFCHFFILTGILKVSLTNT